MKFFLSILLFITLNFNAQGPQGFNYQATVRNATGDLILNENVSFKFNILQGSQTAVSSYTETHDVLTDDLGQVSLVIGKGTPSNGVSSDIDWSLGNYFLAIELNTGSGYIAMGTTQFYSVPYALYAENAGSASTAVTAENAGSTGTSLDTSIKGNIDSYILKNLLPENVTDSIKPLGANVLQSEQTSDGVRIFQYGLSGNIFTSYIGVGSFNLIQGHKYALCWKQRYNQEDAQTYNGHGFVLYNGSSFNTLNSKGVSNPIRIPLNSSKLWYNCVSLIDFDLATSENRLVYRAYAQPDFNASKLIVDVNIKDIFLLDLGVDGDYFYDKSFEFFKSVLSDKKWFKNLAVQDSSSDSDNTSSYNGGLLKSLGDSMPETRSYQYIVANALGMTYDNDDAGTVDVNGTPTAHLKFVIGGTWCAPVTTAQINSNPNTSQALEKSAYIRSRFLKYYNPKVLIIQCGTNDAPSNSAIYSGKNPDGTTPYNYGLNDAAYVGDGVDLRNDVYQDANGFNLAPSLGASFRGMLNQIYSDMPDIKVVVIGMPRSARTFPDRVDFYAYGYETGLAKNEVLKKVAAEFGATFVDIFNNAGINTHNFEYTVIDAVHFSTEGGRKVAMAILKAAF